MIFQQKWYKYQAQEKNIQQIPTVKVEMIPLIPLIKNKSHHWGLAIFIPFHTWQTQENLHLKPRGKLAKCCALKSAAFRPVPWWLRLLVRVFLMFGKQLLFLFRRIFFGQRVIYIPKKRICAVFDSTSLKNEIIFGSLFWRISQRFQLPLLQKKHLKSCEPLLFLVNLNTEFTAPKKCLVILLAYGDTNFLHIHLILMGQKSGAFVPT